MTVRQALLLIVAAGLAACSGNGEGERDTRQLVQVATAESGRLEQPLAFSGVLRPVERARLAFQSAGILRTRPAALGSVVMPGELLATLDNPELGPAQRAAAAALQETLARRDQARRDLARLVSLERTDAVGEDAVEQKRAELAALDAALARAEADLAATRQRLEDASLVAPFAGVISEVAAEPGEFLGAGQMVMGIGGLDRVEVELGLPAALIGQVTPGMSLRVEVPQLPGREWQGRVTELSAIGDTHSGLFPVVVAFGIDPRSTPLRPGMLARAWFERMLHEGLILPLNAVIDPVGGAPRVYRLDDGHVRSVPVQVVAASGSRVGVVVGPEARLAAGDRVVVAGHRALTDGQPVRVAR
ncbi:MAG: efflux RND transporter periplasmic adaptor subunit [Xanthomonadales bacterium]|nr:efflux RND transporter periplasmic adaptor subunit [Xanthomonadales bacterium]NIN60217.1 efflux RND transporter periplasmic adaptor subunit [Xanthomonadales bacterium]NIN74379.1 efflux RND transporter periplasmic adaptor subunit [Xanthomonadales bacterium]NIO13184.1 efflux RND transporter periplasmic adaptor subunit [Xanthomonadales bacterium]NIP12610.1 efflux RND transporter periplasmic adaptor subunit [Xanthomonadales bacterium]